MSTLSVNRLHPHFARFDASGLDSAQTLDPEAIKVAFFALDGADSLHGVDVLVEAGSFECDAFATAGFVEVMQCHEISVCLDDVEIVYSGGGDVVSIIDSGLERAQWVRFLARRYRETHVWSPVAALSEHDWDGVVGEVELGLSVAMVCNGELVGASSALQSQGRLDVVWSFGQGADEALQLKDMLGFQLGLARQQGLSQATFEIDSTHPALYQQLDWLKPSHQTVWTRLRFEPRRA